MLAFNFSTPKDVAFVSIKRLFLNQKLPLLCMNHLISYMILYDKPCRVHDASRFIHDATCRIELRGKNH